LQGHPSPADGGLADPAAYPHGVLEGREAEGILVVQDAGEKLYRLADGSVPGVS
jgi:hypothetical protein